MFNITKEVCRLQQLKYAKIYGLPNKRKQYDKKVNHVDDIPFDIKAEQEDEYISRRFINKSLHFGRRLSKRKGQKHHPGGGFAGHTIKGG